jgi:hypothetical protein
MWLAKALAALAALAMFVAAEIAVWSDPTITDAGALAITGLLLLVAAFVCFIAATAPDSL